MRLFYHVSGKLTEKRTNLSAETACRRGAKNIDNNNTIYYSSWGNKAHY